MPEPWVAGISLLFVACSFSLDLPEKKGDERRRESESVRERERRQDRTRQEKKRVPEPLFGLRSLSPVDVAYLSPSLYFREANRGEENRRESIREGETLK